MIMKMYSVYDSKAVAFLPPFFMHTDNVAKRTFSDCANDVNHMFSKHPEDYTLFCLGTFDDSNAVITVAKQADNLGLAANHKRGYIDPLDNPIASVIPGG